MTGDTLALISTIYLLLSFVFGLCFIGWSVGPRRLTWNWLIVMVLFWPTAILVIFLGLVVGLAIYVWDALDKPVFEKGKKP